MIIYKVTNLINGKIYIGKTTQKINIRRNQHKYSALKTNSKSVFHKAIRKYGWDKFEWSVIDKADSEEELNNKESYWIRYYDTYLKGYNLTYGGDGSVGYKPSKEYFEKIHKKPTNAKLSREQVIEIKKLLVAGNHTQYEIADKFGVTRDTVKCIKTGKSWSHVKVDGFTPSKYSMNGMDNPVSKLNYDDVIKIKLMLKDGVKQQDIADLFNVNRSTIYKIKTGKTWSNIAIDDMEVAK